DATVGLYALVTDTDGITARQDFDIFIDNDDAVNPSATLDAITTGSVVDGHVEAAGDSSYDNAPADADVSGSIALTGTVSDDQRIQTIYLTIAGFDADGAGPTYSAGDEFVLAAWDAVDGRLEYSTILGYPVDSAVGGTLDPVTGHTATFTYQWDSALITNSVTTDVSIAVRGEDFGLATVDATGSTQVDVVPYISSVSTTGGIKDSNIRSMDGYYSIATSTAAATITINGYNLRPVAGGVRISSDSNGTTGLNLGDMQGIALGNVSVDPSYTWLTTDANSDRSGYLAIITGVDGALIPTINNDNDNSLSQNEEDDTFAKNLLLTDDRYIRFFNIFETGIVNGYYPDMMMEDGPDADSDPDLPTFGSVDDSAAFDLTLARESVTNESPFTTVRNPLSRGLGWLQHGMGRDDGGSYFHVSTYNFSTGHQILFH
ncbi:MAG: hypothetical protein KAU31_15195, partial [Spirochaetaceae bacterium]|nr:hypothetical protein [Spirochaetaceae bacterium]